VSTHADRRVAIVHADRPLGAVTVDMVAAMRETGAGVDVIRPATEPFPLTNEVAGRDLYVMKHSDEVCLSAGAVLHATGAATFNRYPVVAVCRDKAVTTARLSRAGLPVPESHLVSEPAMAAPLLRGGALVVKPSRGSKGQGVRMICGPGELSTIDPRTGPFLVQRHHRPDGLDRKLYRIGRRIFCVGRTWPASSLEDKLGEPIEVDTVLRRIALGVGGALNSDLFGADVVISDGRAWLVDVSSFPGFKGVPDAGRLLADRVLAAAAEAANADTRRFDPIP
jgi:ribosomal protein S6--L-glutamate ligase